MTRPTVYVIQAPRAPSANYAGVDLSSAADFGRIEFILPSHAQPSLEPERALEMLRLALKNYKEGDYIVSVGGDPAGIFLAGLCLPEEYDGPIQWLRWERRKDEHGNRLTAGFYLPMQIDLGYENEEQS